MGGRHLLHVIHCIFFVNVLFPYPLRNLRLFVSMRILFISIPPTAPSSLFLCDAMLLYLYAFCQSSGNVTVRDIFQCVPSLKVPASAHPYTIFGTVVPPPSPNRYFSFSSAGVSVGIFSDRSASSSSGLMSSGISTPEGWR